jgi:hypothetical protein
LLSTYNDTIQMPPIIIYINGESYNGKNTV